MANWPMLYAKQTGLFTLFYWTQECVFGEIGAENDRQAVTYLISLLSR